MPLVVVQDPAGKNIGQATWTYNIADGAFDFLAVGEKLTLTYMARVDNNYAPNNETTFVPFTIVITGTNDKPTISATGGTITEQIGTGNTAVDTVTGTVTFADVDLTDRPVVSTAISTTDPFRYYDADGNDVTATLTPAQLAAILAVEVPLSVVQGAGNTHNGSATWTYSVEDSKFDFIAKGETLTLNYVAQVDDGHGGVVSTPITVSIHGADVVVVGTNDVPTIAATSDAFAELAERPGVERAPYGVRHHQLHRRRPDRPAGGERRLHLVHLPERPQRRRRQLIAHGQATRGDRRGGTPADGGAGSRQHQ